MAVLLALNTVKYNYYLDNLFGLVSLPCCFFELVIYFLVAMLSCLAEFCGPYVIVHFEYTVSDLNCTNIISGPEIN